MKRSTSIAHLQYVMYRKGGVSFHPYSFVYDSLTKECGKRHRKTSLTYNKHKMNVDLKKVFQKSISLRLFSFGSSWCLLELACRVKFVTIIKCPQTSWFYTSIVLLMFNLCFSLNGQIVYFLNQFFYFVCLFLHLNFQNFRWRKLFLLWKLVVCGVEYTLWCFGDVVSSVKSRIFIMDTNLKKHSSGFKKNSTHFFFTIRSMYTVSHYWNVYIHKLLVIYAWL